MSEKIREKIRCQNYFFTDRASGSVSLGPTNSSAPFSPPKRLPLLEAILAGVFPLLDSMTHITGYSRLTRLQARAVLALAALAMASGVALTLSPLASSNLAEHRNTAGDIALYRAEVDRIRDGQSYHQAAAAELTARGYPTRSVFNWRTPLPMWLLGKLPALAWGKALLGGLALALMLLAFEALAREENANGKPRPVVAPQTANPGRGFALARPVACALLLTGPLLPTILGDLFLLPVLWAGVLIALSACAYGVGRFRLGMAIGLAAVFFRELALPYCLVCMAMAWRQGRRGELAGWTLGLLGWLVFFGWHGWQVSGLISPDARAHQFGWVQCGGAAFVISTAQLNAYLLLLPQWATAIYLASALVGLAGWSTPLGTRIGLSACAFLAAFAVVGQSFNQYWGCLIAPLLCFGVARFPVSARELWRAASGMYPAAAHGHRPTTPSLPCCRSSEG